MNIIVTGATGFVGQHLVPLLLQQKHQVIAVARNEKRAKQFDWYEKVQFISHDIHYETLNLSSWGTPKILVHLAWSALPNYNSLHHLEENLPGDQRFLRQMVEWGIEHVLVTGTCFEFGKQNGPLSPNMPTLPDNPYSIAKDTLRRWLLALQYEKKFVLQWVRLFYVYGPGQNPNSILSQLDRAIDNGESIFNMSGGEQLRDYLSVEEVVKYIVEMLNDPEKKGIFHCCSGKPISIRCLVEEHIEKRNASIELNLGYYPYLEHEAMKFWGSEK